MKTFALLTAVVCATLLAGSSQAAQLASPATYASTSQRSAQCVIGNTSTKPIQVTVRIVDEAGNAFPVSSTCGQIEPQFVCSAFANGIPFNAAVACSATTSGSADKLRGSLTLYDSEGNALRSSELR